MVKYRILITQVINGNDFDYYFLLLLLVPWDNLFKGEKNSTKAK